MAKECTMILSRYEVLHTYMILFYGPLDFVWDYLGEPVPEPIWILLKQETVSGNSISWDTMI